MITKVGIMKGKLVEIFNAILPFNGLKIAGIST
jgi:hypothetical protein